MTPKAERLNITLHDVRGNVTSLTALTQYIARHAYLSEKQVRIFWDNTETVLGRKYKMYRITSNTKVSFARWQVCQAFVEGVQGV